MLGQCVSKSSDSPTAGAPSWEEEGVQQVEEACLSAGLAGGQAGLTWRLQTVRNVPSGAGDEAQ